MNERPFKNIELKWKNMIIVINIKIYLGLTENELLLMPGTL